MKSKHKPIAVKVGNVTVKIYRVKTRGYDSFQVADYTTGKRKLESFASEREARDAATTIAVKVAKLDGAVLTLSSDDRVAYLRALELLKPTGIPLELAAAYFTEAQTKLAGRSLNEAVEYFLKRNPSAMPRKTLSEIFTEFLIAKQADGVSAVYLKDLKFRVGKFAEAFHGQMAAVDAVQVNEWLRARKCGPRGRNNYRLAISMLFKFAESLGYVTIGHLDFHKIAKAREAHAEIEIFAPTEMEKLLSAAQLNPNNLKPGFNLRYATGSGLVPFLVLGGFAGLRTAEIERQLWEDIILERGFIRVTAAKGNTAQKRLVPISTNLRQWLAVHRRESGPVCEIVRTADAIHRLAERAKVEWKHNALRHSFISYRVAETQNIPQVSLEAGNSPKMINKHYRELVTPDEAKAWFSISPATSGKWYRQPFYQNAKDKGEAYPTTLCPVVGGEFFQILSPAVGDPSVGYFPEAVPYPV